MNTSRGVPPLVKENSEWNEIYMMVVKWNIYAVYVKELKRWTCLSNGTLFMTLNMTIITDEDSNTNIMPRGLIKINFNNGLFLSLSIINVQRELVNFNR